METNCPVCGEKLSVMRLVEGYTESNEIKVSFHTDYFCFDYNTRRFHCRIIKPEMGVRLCGEVSNG